MIYKSLCNLLSDPHDHSDFSLCFHLLITGRQIALFSATFPCTQGKIKFHAKKSRGGEFFMMFYERRSLTLRRIEVDYFSVIIAHALQSGRFHRASFGITQVIRR